MRFDLDRKTVSAFLLSAALVVLQAVLGYYDNGITLLGWLGIAATVLAPTGLVAVVDNTPFSPATKAWAQGICMVGLVFVQGVEGVYAKDGGISTGDWLMIAVAVLTAIGPYLARPGADTKSAAVSPSVA